MADTQALSLERFAGLGSASPPTQRWVATVDGGAAIPTGLVHCQALSFVIDRLR